MLQSIAWRWRAGGMGGKFIRLLNAAAIVMPVTYLHERQVAWQVKYASGKVFGIVLSMPPLNFSFKSY